MPRRQGRPPIRNPQGLGAEDNSNTSADSVASASPNRSGQNRRRSASVSNRNNDRSRSQNKLRAFSEGRRGAKALAEIRYLQNTTSQLIPKLPFARLVREVMMEFTNRQLRITPEALMAIQEASEIFMVQLFEDCQKLALHRSRVTITKQDMDLALYFRASL